MRAPAEVAEADVQANAGLVLEPFHRTVEELDALLRAGPVSGVGGLVELDDRAAGGHERAQLGGDDLGQVGGQLRPRRVTVADADRVRHGQRAWYRDLERS